MDPILGGGPFSMCLRCHQKMDLWQENGSKAHLGWGTILHVLKVLPEYGPMAYPAKWNDDPFWEDHRSSQKPPCTSLRSSIMESWVSMRSSIMEAWVSIGICSLFKKNKDWIAIPAQGAGGYSRPGADRSEGSDNKYTGKCGDFDLTFNTWLNDT